MDKQPHCLAAAESPQCLWCDVSADSSSRASPARSEVDALAAHRHAPRWAEADTAADLSAGASWWWMPRETGAEGGSMRRGECFLVAGSHQIKCKD